MGWSQKRATSKGKERWRSCYRDARGQIQTAGTYATEKQADKAWQRAEAKAAEGRMSDPRRGRQTFRRYVTATWLPNHVMEASTREGYTYQIDRHIMPWFGGMKMIEILPSDVREWVTHLSELKNDEGKAAVSPTTIRNLKNMLSAIFTTALNDQVIFLHPCKGVKTPPVAVKPPKIISPEQFDAIYQALPEKGDSRLLVELDIESGLRWGELTELRPRDIDVKTRILTVSRAVVQVNTRFHPDGKRFIVKEYPKDREWRRFKLTAQIVAKVTAHVSARGLGPDDLLFQLRQDSIVAEAEDAAKEKVDHGRTKPNEAGRTYRHGSLSAYSAGKCHCEHCRKAYADYRAGRRAEGKDAPRRVRRVDTDGHIPRDWFREQVWKPALVKAKLDEHVAAKYLRHAHASWLLHGGADLQVVKERMGHAKISTTERYLGTLPEVDETALDAFSKIRNRGKEVA
ncbi:MAG TPA: site-specific integrase [Streptosporangiaceae bacterium]|nr:site-specific integrase [Streptosporangiaceae bacterium]